VRARATFDVVTARRAVGRVEAFPVPNAHADGTVAYWHAPSGVPFQGDLFYIPERGEVPPAFPVTDALERAVRAQGLAVSSVVGMHGRTGTWAEVRASLDRRRVSVRK
jgi:glyoxylase-like metal-dependent hydrolase (beta-lactamase superfamily II)